MPDLNKIIEDLSSLTVAEAAELSKQLEEKWGVTPMAAAAPAAAGGAGVVGAVFVAATAEARPAATSTPSPDKLVSSTTPSSTTTTVPSAGVYDKTNDVPRMPRYAFGVLIS